MLCSVLLINAQQSTAQQPAKHTNTAAKRSLQKPMQQTSANVVLWPTIFDANPPLTNKSLSMAISMGVDVTGRLEERNLSSKNTWQAFEHCCRSGDHAHTHTHTTKFAILGASRKLKCQDLLDDTLSMSTNPNKLTYAPSKFVLSEWWIARTVCRTTAWVTSEQWHTIVNSELLNFSQNKIQSWWPGRFCTSAWRVWICHKPPKSCMSLEIQISFHVLALHLPALDLLLIQIRTLNPSPWYLPNDKAVSTLEILYHPGQWCLRRHPEEQATSVLSHCSCSDRQQVPTPLLQWGGLFYIVSRLTFASCLQQSYLFKHL